MGNSVWAIGFWTAIVLFQLVAIPALWLKKNDLADVLWGPAFPLCAWAATYFGGHDFSSAGLRSKIVLVLLILWAGRLFFHVGGRNLLHRREDVRYNNWRKEWGRNWLWRSYLQVFVLQALILFLFLTPVLFILAAPSKPPGPVALLGGLLWLTGMFFETVGDEQLRQFKRDPTSQGKLMTTGLWAWTRHPNYFGEVLLWWGVWLIGAELPGAWWTCVAPLGVTYLIIKVSGVSMLENLMKGRPGYEEYAKTVPRFFPRIPKKT